MAEKKVVANFQIEAQSAKQELASLRSAEEAFIASGHALASDLTQGFGEIETAVGKAFDKVSSGGKVSEAQFDALVAKLATMKESIEESGVALEDLPEEFTKALSTAEKQVAALAGGMDAAKKRTTDLKEEFERAGKEAETLANKTKTAGDRIKDAAERADDAFEKFSKTLVENPKEALEQLPRVAGAVIQLRQEIDKAQKSGGPVDPQDIARLKQFEASLESAKNEARTLKIEIDKATAGVNDASQSWQGFDGIINGIAGKFGKVGAAAVGAWAALGEGVRIGNDLNTLFKTDMSEWEKVTERFGAKANAIMAAISDNVVAATKLLLAIFTGDIGEVKRAFGELKDSTVDGAKVMGEALTTYGADWDLLHPKVEKNTDATKANADAQKALAEEQKKAAAEAAAHAAEQKKLEDQILALTISLDANIAKLREMEGAGVDAEHGVINSTAQMGYYAREVAAASMAVEKQRAEVEALTRAHGASDPVVEQARARLQQLESALASAEQRFQGTSKSVKDFETQQVSAEQAGARLRQIIEQQTQKSEELTQQYGAAAAATGQAASSTDSAATATTKVGDAAGTAAPKVELVKDALGNVAIKSSAVATEAGKAATGLDAAAVSAGKLAAAFSPDGVVASIDSITIAVNALNDALIKVHDTAIEVKARLADMDSEGDAATGTQAGA